MRTTRKKWILGAAMAVLLIGMSSASADVLLLARDDSSQGSAQNQVQSQDSRGDQRSDSRQGDGDSRYRQRLSAEEKRQLRLDIKDAGRKIYPSRRH